MVLAFYEEPPVAVLQENLERLLFSPVPQKKRNPGSGPVLVQFSKKTEFRFQFHFWISKLDPVPDNYFTNFISFFKNLGSGYRTEVNLKPSSDPKNDSSLILGN